MMKIKLLLLTTSIGFLGFAQTNLSMNQAFELALKHNHGIELARQNLKVAQINASILNNGQLPTVSAGASGNISNQANEFELVNGESRTTDPVQNVTYGANLTVAYTLFDGGVRMFNIRRAEAEMNLATLDLRETIETTYLQIANLYLDLQVVQSQLEVLKTNLEISRDRFNRAKKLQEYGQSTGLEALNAELDFQNDSIAFMDLQNSMDQIQRALNLQLGQKTNRELNLTDSLVQPKGLLDTEAMRSLARANNRDVLQIQQTLEIAHRNLQAAKARRIPKITLQGAYAYSKSEFGFNPNFNSLATIGPSLNAGITWNIFDGGLSKRSVEINQVQIKTAQVQEDLLRIQLEQELMNAVQNMENSLALLRVRNKALEIAQRNFQRTREAFANGQTTSLEFRQAQINLFNTESSRIETLANLNKLDLQIKQITGQLIN